jgi:transcriptional regulator with XRE-family HTH domain
MPNLDEGSLAQRPAQGLAPGGGLSRAARAPRAREGEAQALGAVIDQIAFGRRVRRLREAGSLSLRELALRSGVSAPMLSQVERGETSPTLSIAGRIAAGLQLRLSELLRLDEEGAVTVLRAEQRRRGGNARRGHSYEIASAPAPGQRAELSLHLLAPGGSTGSAEDPPMHEPGAREIALVLSGALTFTCDGVTYILDEGDSVTFDADLPHHFENTGRKEARFLAVLAAGLRRS